jgi:hypothetical protein
MRPALAVEHAPKPLSVVRKRNQFSATMTVSSMMMLKSMAPKSSYGAYPRSTMPLMVKQMADGMTTPSRSQP